MKKLNPDSKTVKAVLASDFAAFYQKSASILMPGVEYLDCWHIHNLSYHLDRVRRGECRKLIINIPPRMGKSLITTVSFTCFLQVHNPSIKIMTITYSKELSAVFHNLARKLLKAPWIRLLNGALRVATNKKTSDPLKDTETLIETTQGGYRYSTTLGAAITGFGADIIIVDDPNNTTDIESEAVRRSVNDTFDKTISTRLNNKNGAIIVIQQRTHLNDLTGHLLEKGGWTVVSIPAIADVDMKYDIGNGQKYSRAKGSLIDPRRFDEKYLEDVRRTMGSARYEAQYQQNPLPPEGNIIKAKYLKFVDKVPEFQYVAISVDVAGTSGAGDYSAFLVWGYRDKVWYLTDVYRERVNAVELNSLYKKIDRIHEPDCTIIEVNGIGQSAVHFLRKDGFAHVHGASVTGDKITRCEEITPLLERGEVAILKSMDLFETFMSELLTFPAVPYDDMVDAFVLLLHRQRFVLQQSRWHRRPKRNHMPHDSGVGDGGFVIRRPYGGNRYAQRIGEPLF